jgi:DNA-binding transcriptional MerR regulator
MAATYKIGAVAALTHVSVRTLHHYDDLGLVTPSARTASGYRVYDARDLERLQRVLFLRELGFGLEPIARMLANPKLDWAAALREQRARLAAEAAQRAALLDLIDRTLLHIERGEPMNPNEMFDGFDPKKHEEEAQAKWGKTASYAESQRRTKGYTKDDWAKVKAEALVITEAFAALKAEGVQPTDARAMDVAERHRLHIDRWFYACSRQMHAQLGEMYVADERFAANYEKHAAGLAQFVRDAVQANAAR